MTLSFLCTAPGWKGGGDGKCFGETSVILLDIDLKHLDVCYSCVTVVLQLQKCKCMCFQ